ncbi:hypothetical protein KC19_VG307300 [Ceratodon purpureus]|uniref:Uncharacterized protein n=1 Tax=Ceratodon purpureus TaxID=3225 RepID=A0A8T0HWB7_CERPU|nr:hypothetical protein KC19_VG307300 [Ceratodon purpureus]
MTVVTCIFAKEFQLLLRYCRCKHVLLCFDKEFLDPLKPVIFSYFCRENHRTNLYLEIRGLWFSIFTSDVFVKANFLINNRHHILSGTLPAFVLFAIKCVHS